MRITSASFTWSATAWTAQRRSVSILIQDASTKRHTGIRQAESHAAVNEAQATTATHGFYQKLPKIRTGAKGSFSARGHAPSVRRSAESRFAAEVDPDWRFAERYRDLIDSYLRLGGWRFDIDLGLRMARAVHEAGTQRVRFTKLESLVLCALRLHYHEQMRLATDQER